MWMTPGEEPPLFYFMRKDLTEYLTQAGSHSPQLAASALSIVQHTHSTCAFRFPLQSDLYTLVRQALHEP